MNALLRMSSLALPLGLCASLAYSVTGNPRTRNLSGVGSFDGADVRTSRDDVLIPMAQGSPAETNWYSVIAPPGFSLIANHFEHGSNTVAEVLPSVPQGTMLYKWVVTNGTYTVNQFIDGAWLVPEQTLGPGEGAFVRNPTTNSFQLTFSGEPPKKTSLPLLYHGWNLISLPSPGLTQFTPQEEDVIVQVHAPEETYTVHTFSFGQWWDSPPNPKIGESFFYKSSLGPEAPPPLASTLYFATLVPADNINVRFPSTDDPTLPGFSGSNFLGQIYAGHDSSSLMPVGQPIAFGTGNFASYLLGGVVSLEPLSGPVTVEVRVWEAPAASFESAGISGRSFPLAVNLSGFGPLELPADLIGLKSTSIGPLSAPVITTQPLSQVVALGDAVYLKVVAQGAFTYQWFLNSILIAGATNATLILDNVTTNQAGVYTVGVSNPAGSVISAPATLTIKPLRYDPLEEWRTVRMATETNLNAIAFKKDRFVAVGDRGFVLSSTDGSAWRPSQAGTNALLATAAGGGLFLTIDNGFPSPQVFSSVDGMNWVATQIGGSIYGLSYGNGSFVAVGSTTVPSFSFWQTVAEIARSTDGRSWTDHTIQVPAWSRAPGPSGQALRGVAVGPALFVAVGDAGAILTSVDGANWTEQEIGITLHAVTFGNGEFVAVGATGHIFTSADGVSWHEQISGTAEELAAINYGAGQFVAVGGAGTILSSPDSLTWTNRNSGTTNRLAGIAFGNDTFVLVGEGGVIIESGLVQPKVGFPEFMTQPYDQTVFAGTDVLFSATARSDAALSYQWQFNGTNILGATNRVLSLPTVATNQAGFYTVVAGSAAGTVSSLPAKLIVKTALDQWLIRATPANVRNLNAITYGNGQFIAVGESGIILSSPDGEKWTARASTITNNLNGILYGNGRFVAVGDLGAIVNSEDGLNWVSVGSGTTSALTSVAYGNGIYVAVGRDTVTSADGIHWMVQSSGSGSLFSGIAYGAGQFVAVTTDGVIYSSSGGTLWTKQHCTPCEAQIFVPEGFFGVTHGPELFVAVGGGSYFYLPKGPLVHFPIISSSPDGLTWKDGPAPAGEFLGVTYGEGGFVAVGGNSGNGFTPAGVIASSPDGAAWTLHDAASNNWLRGVAYGNGTFVAVGDGGVILQSGQFSTRPRVSVSTLAGSGVAGYRDASAGQAQFNEPNGGFVGPDGMIYIADGSNHAIRRVDSMNGDVLTVAGTGKAGFLDGPAPRAQFNTPLGVFVAGKIIYVADTLNHRIRKIEPGIVPLVSTVAGSGQAGYQDGPALTAEFNFPNDLVVDAKTNIYVCEFYNHTIRIIHPDGLVTTFIGNGMAGTNNGLGMEAQLNFPAGIAVDLEGNFFITEWSSHRIRKATPDGRVTTYAGSSVSGFVNGPAATAQFYEPDGIAVDLFGDIFITEHHNHSIRKISRDGQVSTLAGTGLAGYADGDGSVAQFSAPGGLGVDLRGHIFVADTGNHVVRKITFPDVAPVWANLRANSIQLSAAGGLSLSVEAPAGSNLKVETSEDLIHWAEFVRIHMPANRASVDDPEAHSKRYRFYRARVFAP